MRFESKKGQKEKKWKIKIKIAISNLKKRILFTAFLLAGFLAWHFQDDLLSLRRCSNITF